jgi:hypothetical protein
MIDLEISLAKAFNWSLRDIDETDIESLLPFVARFARTQTGAERPTAAPKKRVYCDQVDWLTS